MSNENWETWKFQIKVIMNAADIFDVSQKSRKPVLAKIGPETEDDARKSYGVDFSVHKKVEQQDSKL